MQFRDSTPSVAPRSKPDQSHSGFEEESTQALAATHDIYIYITIYIYTIYVYTYVYIYIYIYNL